jgi:hypothetical protein
MGGCCASGAADEQREPLIRDELVPRLASLAREHQTRFALLASNAQRSRMLGALAEADQADADAQREQAYYRGLVTLKRLLEDSRLALDSTSSAIQWNAEVASLLAQMPDSARQDLGPEFALHFTAAPTAAATQ